MCALWGALTGCSGGDASTGWEVSVDSSAGYPVVVNTPPGDVIAPTWELVEEVRIGAVEGTGPEVFGEIRGLAVLDDGRVAVLDYQAQAVRLFAPDGTWMRTFGGRGAGPGELADANGLIATADGHLLVHDPGNDRRTLFHPDSGLVATLPVDIRSYGYTWASVEDERGVVWDTNVILLPDGGGRIDILQGMNRQGVLSDTVELGRRPPISLQDEAPGAYRWSRPDGMGGGVMSVPFWPRGFRKLDGSGHFWQKAADVNDYRIARTTWAGDTTLVFESRRPTRPVEGAARDSAIEAIRERVQQELDWSRIPAERPVVEGLHVATDGRLWVHVGAPGQALHFDVFGPDGVYQGTATTEMRLRPYMPPVIRGDTVWAMVTDELDVPYVVRAVLREAEAAH